MRDGLRILHRWLGLLLVVPLLAQGITGAILTLEPLFRSAALGPALPASADKIVAVASGAASNDLRATRYVPPTATTPAEVWFAPSSNPRGRAVIVRVNAATLTPISPPDPQNGVIDWCRRLHHDFLLSEYGGRSIVGWVGVGLVLMSLIGIPLWWPAKGQRRAAFTFPIAARGFRLHRQVHGALGVWTLILLLVSAATGVVLGFPRTARDVMGIGGEGSPRATGSRASTSAPAKTLDAALDLAGAAEPGLSPRVLFLPASGGPMRVILAPPGAEGMASMTTITVDAAGTRVLGIQDPRNMSGPDRALRQIHDIHFGQGFGVVWRVLTAAAGLALPIFAATGTAMWLYRRRLRARSGPVLRKVRRAAAPAGEQIHP
jgi:uncharacterized iron-regulated membrane protein